MFSLQDAVDALRQHTPVDQDAGSTAGADTFRASLRALLTRTLSPGEGERVIRSLDDMGLLEPTALGSANPAEILGLLSEQGIKLSARTLRPLLNLAHWFDQQEREGRDIEAFRLETLRQELGSIRGLGSTNVDAILLFGFGKPIVPVSRGIYRILVRHGWIDPSASLEEAQESLASIATEDLRARQSIVQALERVGDHYCRLKAPRCDDCPLRPFLPEGGPIEPESIPF